MLKKLLKTLFTNGLLVLFLLIQGCSNQASIANRYLTAESLWTEKNYAAAVAEFDQILKEDPNSAIALQAMLRSSMTKTLFLNKHQEALEGFKLYIARAASSEQVPSVEKQIGDIYYFKLKDYQSAIQHYQHLIETKKFGIEDTGEFSYRIARSYFLMGKIKNSIEVNETIVKQKFSSDLKARAYLDLGHSWYALGDSEKNGFQNAIIAYTKAETEIKNPKSTLYLEAEFGIASSMEELDQLEQAFSKFKTLEEKYPSPNVIKVKLLRLEARLKKKRK